MGLDLTDEMKEIRRRYNQLNAEKFEGDYDFVVVHDPQPSKLLDFNGRHGGKNWIWRCHIDTSEPSPAYLIPGKIL